MFLLPHFINYHKEFEVSRFPGCLNLHRKTVRRPVPQRAVVSTIFHLKKGILHDRVNVSQISGIYFTIQLEKEPMDNVWKKEALLKKLPTAQGFLLVAGGSGT